MLNNHTKFQFNHDWHWLTHIEIQRTSNNNKIYSNDGYTHTYIHLIVACLTACLCAKRVTGLCKLNNTNKRKTPPPPSPATKYTTTTTIMQPYNIGACNTLKLYHTNALGPTTKQNWTQRILRQSKMYDNSHRWHYKPTNWSVWWLAMTVDGGGGGGT